MIRVHKYVYAVSESRNVTIEFLPLATGTAPGFTHRVLIGGESVDWLSDTSKPNTRAAGYFLRKHKAIPEGK